MKVNHYYLRARLFPTALTAIPAIVFYNNFIASTFHESLANVSSTLPLITNATLSGAIVFLLTQINRMLAKEIFQKRYFQDELKMPTTNHLLWEDDFYDDSIKRKIRNKIREKYDITLLTPDEERADGTRARKLITSAVSQIRIHLKDNPMLLQHNIDYGFIRNLVGGSIPAVIFSVMILIFAFIHSNRSLKIFGFIFLAVYLFILFSSKFVIKRYGHYYSKILYEQFLNQPNR